MHTQGSCLTQPHLKVILKNVTGGWQEDVLYYKGKRSRGAPSNSWQLLRSPVSPEWSMTLDEATSVATVRSFMSGRLEKEEVQIPRPSPFQGGLVTRNFSNFRISYLQGWLEWTSVNSKVGKWKGYGSIWFQIGSHGSIMSVLEFSTYDWSITSAGLTVDTPSPLPVSECHLWHMFHQREVRLWVSGNDDMTSSVRTTMTLCNELWSNVKLTSWKVHCQG